MHFKIIQSLAFITWIIIMLKHIIFVKLNTYAAPSWVFCRKSSSSTYSSHLHNYPIVKDATCPRGVPTLLEVPICWNFRMMSVSPESKIKKKVVLSVLDAFFTQNVRIFKNLLWVLNKIFHSWSCIFYLVYYLLIAFFENIYYKFLILF
jgi:hypothetical protein